MNSPKSIQFLKEGKDNTYPFLMKIETFLKLKDSSFIEYMMDEYTVIYVNDIYELIFLEKELISIALRSECWLGKHNIYGKSLEVVLTLLIKCDIQWEFFPKYCFNDQLCVQTQGGVQLMFLFGKNDSQGQLTKIIKGEL